MKNLLYVSVLFSLNAFADYECGKLMLTPEDSKAADSLQELLQPRIQTLSRDVEVFHWRSMDRKSYEEKGLGSVSGVVEPHDTQVENYTKNQTQGWWQENLWNKGYGLLVGNGLYAARDPFASSKYGGHKPALMVLTYPKGSKFIDFRERADNESFSYLMKDELRELNHLPLNQSTKEALNAAGCPASDKMRLQHGFFGNPKCDRFMKEVFCRENIKMFNHDWHDSKPPGCKRSRAAFNVVAPPEPENIMTLTAQLPTGSTPAEIKARKLASNLMHFANENTDQYYGEGSPQTIKNMWSASKEISQPNKAEYKEWKSKLVDCGDHPEDKNENREIAFHPPELCPEEPAGSPASRAPAVEKLMKALRGVKK